VRIAERSVTSVAWNAVASVMQVLIGIVRSVLLARLLPVDAFGVYSMAGSIVGLTAVVAGFGTDDAFLHRASETENEDQAAAVWLSLLLIFATAWLALLALGAFWFSSGSARVALLTIAVTRWGVILTAVPRQILVRRVVHRRLALIQLIDLVLSALAAVLLAWRGMGIWALLSTDIVTVALSIGLLYLWRPVWRPRLAWSGPTVRYFVRFGSQSLLAKLLQNGLDRVDDLWTGSYLGSSALGFYSRAYAFATYPRSILASSVNRVAGGTYAELAASRKRLSRAFFRTNALLVRTGFFLGGLLALAAPEFIRVLLGTKWLPMLAAFRLMLIFTLLDPIKMTVANLFVAVGRPSQIVRARAVQLAVMVAALFALGPSQGIAGVALAVDIMLLVGIVILLKEARDHVDFSVWSLFAAPSLSVAVAMLLARGTTVFPGVTGAPWLTGLVKTLVFSAVYGASLLVLERRQVLRMMAYALEILIARREPSQRRKDEQTV
jgi:O-antigen/teichoic acid export membrane protein